MSIISVSKSVIFILLSFCVTSVQGEARSQFVGFSNLGVNGGAGIFKMQELCDTEYTGSHVCNTTEVAQSTSNNFDFGSDTAAEAWILVDIQYSSDNIVISQFGLVSVAESDKTFDCRGWSTELSKLTADVLNEGATVTREGWFKNTTQCHTNLPVACCK